MLNYNPKQSPLFYADIMCWLLEIIIVYISKTILTQHEQIVS